MKCIWPLGPGFRHPILKLKQVTGISLISCQPWGSGRGGSTQGSGTTSEGTCERGESQSHELLSGAARIFLSGVGGGSEQSTKSFQCPSILKRGKFMMKLSQCWDPWRHPLAQTCEGGKYRTIKIIITTYSVPV